MLFNQLPLSKDLATLNERALLDKVERPVLPAITLVLLDVEVRVVELPFGK
jgi:hypothetical protein